MIIFYIILLYFNNSSNSMQSYIHWHFVKMPKHGNFILDSPFRSIFSLSILLYSSSSKESLIVIYRLNHT